MHPPSTSIEGNVIVLVQWMKLGIETVGVALVAIGVCVAIAQLARILAARQHTEFTDIRLTLARYLALALEFELGADILGTAVSPSQDQIGKLGAVAVIRTGLNFFLSMEMKQEKTVKQSQPSDDIFVAVVDDSANASRSTPKRSPEKRAVFPKQCGARRGGNPQRGDVSGDSFPAQLRNVTRTPNTATMKTKNQLSLFKAGLPAILALTILAAFAAGLSGCASSGGSSAGGTHEMGPPKSPSRMSNQSMPGR